MKTKVFKGLPLSLTSLCAFSRPSGQRSLAGGSAVQLLTTAAALSKQLKFCKVAHQPPP